MFSKISVIGFYFFPEIGAAASRIYNMAQYLKSKHFDVEVITALPNYPQGKTFSGYQKKIYVSEVIDGITVKRYWLYASNSERTIPRMLSMLSISVTVFLAIPHLLIRRPDIVIVNSPPLLLGFSGVLLSKLCGARTVINVSDIWPLTAFELGVIHKKGLYYKMLRIIERFVYSRADLCMAQSQEILTHINRSYPSKPKFFYPNLSHRSGFIDDVPRFNPRKLKIIYAGLLGVPQGILDICQNVDFKRLDVEFHIYGNGNERTMVEKYLNKNPDVSIFLHDPVRKEDLPEILSNFHATLVPLKSRVYGAVPSKIYMAISAGLPVLFMGEGEAREIVEKYQLGWTSNPLDYVSLVANIETLVGMGEEKYHAMRKHISHLGETQFDINTLNNQLLDFLDQGLKKLHG